jgi:hypothetical protein
LDDCREAGLGCRELGKRAERRRLCGGARRAAVRGRGGAGGVLPLLARRGEHAEALLGSCRGFLHADSYAGFNTLFAADPKTGTARLAEVACWARARPQIL